MMRHALTVLKCLLFLLPQDLWGVPSIFDYSSEESKLLKGQWTYYPGKFLHVSDLDRNTDSVGVDIPGSMPRHNANEPGWGTLVTTIVGLETIDEDMAISLRANTAYTLWVKTERGLEPILEVGNYAETPGDSIPEIVNRIGRIEKRLFGDRLTIVIHISGWHYSEAKVWTPPRFEPFKKSQSRAQWTHFGEVLALGILITMMFRKIMQAAWNRTLSRSGRFA